MDVMVPELNGETDVSEKTDELVAVDINDEDELGILSVTKSPLLPDKVVIIADWEEL